jgi:hypothetical protein
MGGLEVGISGTVPNREMDRPFQLSKAKRLLITADSGRT